MERDDTTPGENALRRQLRERIAAMDTRFAKGLGGDHRIGSGIAPGQHISELDFINMSGLTRPKRDAAFRETPVYEPLFDASGIPAAAYPETPPDETPTAPSFYQRGVADVDDAMPPMRMAPSPAQDAAPASASLDALHTLIEDLARELECPPSVSPQTEPESPPPRPDRFPLPPLRQNLIEVEQLLQQLEEQPRERRD